MMNEWIPVSERLPEDTVRECLVTVVHRDVITTEICSYDDGDEERPFCPTDKLLATREHIKRGYPKKMTTAWMPLPQPYKGKKTGNL